MNGENIREEKKYDFAFEMQNKITHKAVDRKFYNKTVVPTYRLCTVRQYFVHIKEVGRHTHTTLNEPEI